MTAAQVKEALQIIWGNLPQGPIDKAVKDLAKSSTESLCWSLNTSNIHTLTMKFWLLIIS